MKLSFTHVLTLVVAIAFLEAGQQTAVSLYSKLGVCALVMATVLLFADIAIAAVESLREDVKAT